MILSKQDILGEIDNNRLSIQPRITKGQLGKASYDLVIGRSCWVPDNDMGEGTVLDPSKRPAVQHFTAHHGLDDPIIVKPSDFLLVDTFEVLTLPEDIGATIQGRSHLAQYGLIVHCTAPYIEPLYSGCLTLQIVNHGAFTLRLNPAETRLCQVIFHRVETPTEEEPKNIM